MSLTTLSSVHRCVPMLMRPKGRNRNINLIQTIIRNFNYQQHESDYDRYVSSRTIVGRVTPQRVGRIQSFIDAFNDENRYPYGQGYSCGHTHDCCGCLVSESMSMDVIDNSITIYHNQSFNY